MKPKRISILGATGSVGRSTAAVVAELTSQGAPIEVEALACGGNLEAVIALARALRPRFVALGDESLRAPAQAALPGVEVAAGPSAATEAAQRPADWVMSAIVGLAGLKPTLAALERGAFVALANKESMVSAGALMRSRAQAAGAVLLPVDSEHNAIFQVLSEPYAVERLTLTASGGPFRTWTRAAMEGVHPAQALAHPTWSMGRKISIDSATLMNKGLELIEAAYLFDVPEGRIDVLVHPQSIVHSLVAYSDGAVLAQLSAPDMRVPIAHALAWPARVRISAARLDLAHIGQLTFEAPDADRFPALRLARAALQRGGGATAALNAANEIAVEAFLAGRLGFLEIACVVEETLERLDAREPESIAKSPTSLDEVVWIDDGARRVAQEISLRRAIAE